MKHETGGKSVEEVNAQGQKQYSYQEYLRKFYPSSSQERERKEEVEDPYELGARMARENIEKVKQAIQGQQ